MEELPPGLRGEAIDYDVIHAIITARLGELEAHMTAQLKAMLNARDADRYQKMSAVGALLGGIGGFSGLIALVTSVLPG
jgi:hypothetical protein